MIESSSKDYAGRLPEDKNFKSNLPDGLKFRGEGSLRLEGHCSSESVRTRRSDTDVGTLVKDSLPTSIKHEYVQWSKVENLGRDRETYDSRSVEYLMDCINEEQSEKVVEQCVHALIRRFKDDGADARRAISFICQHENPRSFRWPYLVQSLGVSKTGQHCLADLLRNSTLTHDDQLRVIKGTHLVTEVDESLVDSLISFTRPGPSHSNFTSRLSAIVSLGLVTGAGRPSAQITDRVLNHLHSSLYQCPERDYDARASQFIDYVVAYTSAVGNLGHDRSYGTLMQLMDHEWPSVRKASIYSLRSLKLDMIEPVLLRVLTSVRTNAEEKLAAVSAILDRASSENWSPETLNALEQLLYESAGKSRDLDDVLTRFFKRYKSTFAERVLTRAQSIREKQEQKKELIAKVRVTRGIADLLKPLVDKEFGLNERHEKIFGGDMVGANFEAIFRNLAVIYLSIFDGKVEFDILNRVAAEMKMFGVRISLVEGQAAFFAGLSFKNEFLSAIVDAGHQAAQRVVQTIRSAIAVLLQFVAKALTYLEEIHSHADEILKPIEPILNLTRRGLEALDRVVKFGEDVQTFLGQVEDFVLRMTDVNRLIDYIESLKKKLTDFVAKKLGELKTFANRTVSDAVEPVRKVKKLIDKGVGYVNQISTTLDKLEAGDASEYNRIAELLADMVLNGNDEFISSGGNVFNIVQIAYAQLSSLLDGGSSVGGVSAPSNGKSWWPSLSFGGSSSSTSSSSTSSSSAPSGSLLNWKSSSTKKSTGSSWWFSSIDSSSASKPSPTAPPSTPSTSSLFREIKSLKTLFSDFKQIANSVLASKKKGSVSVTQITNMEKTVANLDSALARSKSTIDSFIVMVRSYSDLGKMLRHLKSLASSKLLNSKFVSVDLSWARGKVVALTKVCDKVHEVVDAANGHITAFIHEGVEAYDGLRSKVEAYLGDTVKQIFGSFELDGSSFSVMSVKDLFKQVMEKAEALLDAFIENALFVRFNKVADAFVGNVSVFIDSKIEIVADWYERKVTPVVTKWVNGSKQFIDLVKLARNITDFAIIVGEAVPEVKNTAESVQDMIDKVLDASLWAQDILIRLSSSKTIVGYGEQAKQFIINTIESSLDDLESILRGIVADFKNWIKSVTAEPIRFLEQGADFIDNVAAQVFDVGKEVKGYIDFVDDLRTAALSVKKTFNVTCSLSSSVDKVVRYGDTFKAMWVNLTELVNATADGVIDAVADAADEVAEPVVNLGLSISTFLEHLRAFASIHKNSMREVLTLECVEKFCVADLFEDNVTQLVADAEQIIEDFNAVTDFEGIVERTKGKLLVVRDIAKDAWNQLLLMIERAKTDLDIFRLVKDIINELTSDRTFSVSVGGQKLIRRKRQSVEDQLLDAAKSTAIDFISSQIPKVNALWSHVERFLESSFVQGAMKLVDQVANANVYVCNFFESLALPQEIFKPVDTVMATIRKVGEKLNQFIEQNFLRHLRSVSNTVASYTGIVSDMRKVINNAVFGTIEWALDEFRKFGTNVLTKVKVYLSNLLLLDRGLDAGELKIADELPYCSDEVCIRVKPRSTPRYRDWFFPIKYTHLRILRRGRQVVPGLFEDYQVQGMTSLDWDGTHIALSMFGTGINEELPNLLVVIHKDSGKIKRLYRLFRANGEPLSLPLGLTIANSYLWFAGIEMVTDTTAKDSAAKGVLFGIKTSELGSYSNTEPPVDLTVNAEYDTDSYGTGISYYDNYLWIADFVDRMKTALGTKLVAGHISSRTQYGWAAAYNLNSDGEMVAGKVKVGKLQVLKPARAVTIGEHVVGFLPFDQAWTPYFGILRCVPKPGYICKVEFIQQPNKTSKMSSGVINVPIRYGVKVPLSRGFPVPSGAISLAYIEKSRELTLAFKSGAQAEQALRWVVGGDLEDSFFWLAVPVLENSLSLKDAVKKNEVFLNVLGRTVVAPRPLIPLDKNRRKRDDDYTDCITGEDELYKITKTFVETCFTCLYRPILLGPFGGIIIKLDYAARGTLTVNYIMGLCPAKLEAKASLTGRASLDVEATVALSALFFEAGAGIEATVLDTSLVPTLTLRLKGASLQVCADLNLVTRPLAIRVFAFVRLLGPKISCKAWAPSCRIYLGVYVELQVTIFTWSGGEYAVPLLPESCLSTPDPSPPIKGTVEAVQADWQSLSANWVGFKDDEAEYIEYSVFAGTAPGRDNVMKAQNVQKKSLYAGGGLKFSHGENVFVTVVCTNSAGLKTAATAEPFVADTTPPVVDGLQDGPGPDDAKYSSSESSLQAHYNEIRDESNIESIVFGIGKVPGGDDLQEFRDVKSAKVLSNFDVSLENGVTYYFTIKALNIYGLESITSTNGILVDYTNPVAGYVYDDSLDCKKDSDYQVASIYFKACWSEFEDPESGIDYYEWKLVRSDGLEVFQYLNVKSKLFGYKAGISLVLGRNYFVTARGWNKAGLPTEKRSNGTYVDYTRPECSQVLDLIPKHKEDQDYVTSLSFLTASWYCIDRESGLAKQEAAVGTYPGGSDVVPFTEYPLTKNGSVVAQFKGVPIIPGRPLYVTIKLTNVAGLRRTEWSDGIALDNTPPVAVDIYVRDGPGVRGTLDADFQSSSKLLHVRWHGAFIDNESPIVDCFVGITNLKGSTVRSEISVGKVKEIAFDGLGLISGEVYNASVRCINAAGLDTKVFTDGVLVDTTPPNIGVLYDGLNVGQDIKYWEFSTSSWANFQACLWYNLKAEWPPPPPGVSSTPKPTKVNCKTGEWYDDESGLQYFQTSVESKDNVTVASWKREQTSFTVIGRTMNGQHGKLYAFRLRVYNRVGLYSEAWTNGIIVDETVTELENLIEYDSTITTTPEDVDYILVNHLKLAANWDAKDDESGVEHTDWAIGSYWGGHDIVDYTTVVSKPVTHSMTDLDLGKRYYVLVRITNGAGLRLVASSDGVMVDFQDPSEGYVQDGWGTSDVEYHPLNRTAWMKWRWVEDFESGLDTIEVAVSLRETDAIFKEVPVSSTSAVVSELSMVSGSKYIAYVRATDKAGLSKVSKSNGFIVDTSPPRCNAVREGFTSGADNDIITTTTYLTINWDVCVDADTAVRQYQIAIGRDSNFGSFFDYELRSFGTQTKAAYLGIALQHGVKYFTFLKAINMAGVSSWLVSNGVTVDLTPPQCSHFGDGLTGDKDYESAPGYHAVNWMCSEDVSTIVKTVLSVGTYRGGFDIRRSAVDVLAGKEVDTKTTLREGITLFATLALWNSAGLTTAYTTDGLSVDTSPPSALYVRDGLVSKPDIDYQSSLKSLSANWRFQDAESGMDYYELRVLPSPGDVPRSIKVTASHATVLSTLAQGVVYRSAVKGFNRAGLTVSAESDGVKVDSTPAVCSYLNDGFVAKADVAFMSVWDSPSANWQCSDAESGIVAIKWRVFQRPNTLLREVDVGKTATRVLASAVTLKDGKSYYTVLTLQNAAQLYVNVTSNGFVVDSTPPVIETFTITYSATTRSFDLTWSGKDAESGIVDYSIAIGTEEDLADVLPLKSFATATQASTAGLVTLDSPKTYFFTLTAVNGASGKTSSSASAVTDGSAPIFEGSAVATVIYPSRAFTPDETQISDAVVRVEWTKVTDAETGVRAVRWAIKETGKSVKADYPTYTYSPFFSSKGNVGEIHQFTLTNKVTYEVILEAENGVGLSSYLLSASFTIKFGAFVPGKVLDGPNYDDEDYQPHTAGLWARWENFKDETEGIKSYALGFGTSAGATDVQKLTDLELALQGHAVGTLTLQVGVTYYATVVATNNLGVTVSATSNGITIDSTAPTCESIGFGMSGNLKYFSSSRNVWISWNCSDPESGIDHYDIALGKRPSGNDLVALKNIPEQSNYQLPPLNLTDDTNGYFTLTTFNKAGLFTITNSDRVLFDFHVPDTGTIALSWENKRIRATWSGFKDATGIDYYEWAVGTSEGEDDVVPFAKSGLSTAVLTNELAVVSGTSYYVTVKTTDLAGNSATASSPALVSDLTTPITGLVAEDSFLQELDYFTGQGRLPVVWEECIDDELPITEYLVSLQTSDGKDVKSPVSVGLSTSYSFKTSNLSAGVRYYTKVTCRNSLNLQAHSTSDGFLIDGTKPTLGQITIEVPDVSKSVRFLPWTEIVNVSWSGFSDAESGLSYYSWSLCSGDGTDCPVAVENVELQTKVSKEGVNFNSQRCYIAKVRAVNKAGLSSEAASDCKIFDKTRPIPGTLTIGGNTHSSFWSKSTSITVVWNGFQDDESGIHSAALCVGTKPDLCDAKAETNVTLKEGSIYVNQVQLQHGREIFVSIVVVNRAGLSARATSSGTVIDVTAPTTGVVIDGLGPDDVQYQIVTSTIHSEWFDFFEDVSDIDFYKWGCGTKPGQTDVVPLSNVELNNSASAFGLSMTAGMVVYNYVIAYNSAGLKSGVSSNGFLVDNTPPEFAVVGMGTKSKPYGRYEVLTGEIEAFWDVTDLESGVREVSWFLCENETGIQNCILGPVSVGNASNATAAVDVVAGVCYYVSVEAVNFVSLVSRSKSTCSSFDGTIPSEGTVYHGDSGGNFEVQSDKTTLCATWFGFVDNESPIMKYQWSIGTRPGLHDLMLFTDVGLRTSAVKSRLSLTDGSLYFINVAATNAAGLRRTVESSGVLIDSSAPIVGQVYDGWEDDDIEYSLDSTTVFARWDSFTEDWSRITECSWCAGTAPDSCDISPSIVVEETEVFSTGHKIANGTKVYVNVVCKNSAGLSSGSSSNGYVVDTTPPVSGSVNFGDEAGVAVAGYIENAANVSVEWSGFAETETSIVNYRVALATREEITENCESLHYLNAGLRTNVSLELFTLLPGVQYLAVVRATNVIGLYSEAISGDRIVVDATEPTEGVVLDGRKYDVDDVNYQSDHQSLSAHWTGFSEDISSVSEYVCCFGSGNETDSLGCASVGLNTEATLPGLLLVSGVRYKAIVTAFNILGGSQISQSDGVVVDLTHPNSGIVYDGINFVDLEYQSNPTTVSASWLRFEDEESHIDDYVWEATSPDYATPYISKRSVGIQYRAIASNFAIKSGAKIVVVVTAYNKAGLSTSVASDGVVIDTIPPIAGEVKDGLTIGYDIDFQKVDNNALGAHWFGFVDEDSGIAGYSYAVLTDSYNDSQTWPLVGTIVVAETNVLSSDTEAEMSLDAVHLGRRYYFEVTAYDNAGLSVSRISDGVEIVENDICFDLATWDGDVGYDINATRRSDGIGASVKLIEQSLSCPLNNSVGVSSLVSSDFYYSVIRLSENTTVEHENASQAEETAVHNETWALRYEQPDSPCCLGGKLPLQMGQSDSSLSLVSLKGNPAFSLLAHDTLVVASKYVIAFVSRWDTSDVQIFSAPRDDSSKFPAIDADAEGVIIVVVYKNYIFIFVFSQSAPDNTKSTKAVISATLTPQNVSTSSSHFCPELEVLGNTAFFATTDDVGNVEIAIYVQNGQWQKAASFSARAMSDCNIIITASSTGTVAVAYPATGQVDLYSYDQAFATFDSTIDSATVAQFPSTFTTVQFIPRTSLIAVGSASDGTVAIFSLDRTGYLFKTRCELSNSSFAGKLSVDVDDDVAYLAAYLPSDDSVTIAHFDADSNTCETFGVIRSLKYHSVSDSAHAQIKKQTLAVMVHSSRSKETTIELSAFCYRNNTRMKTGISHIPSVCRPCATGETSTGGLKDDCTNCDQTTCANSSNNHLDVWIDELSLELGNSYRVRVKAEDNGERSLTVDAPSIVIDSTEPLPGDVFDALGQNELDAVSNTDFTPTVSWGGFYDEESGIMEYAWCIGTQPGRCDVHEMRNIGHEVTERKCSLCTKLSAGQKYFSTIFASNWAGLTVSASSNGFIIDTTPPTIQYVRDGQKGLSDSDTQQATHFLQGNWAAGDAESSIEEYRVGYYAFETDVIDYKSAGQSEEWSINNLRLRSGILYYFAVLAVNGAGLSTFKRSDGVSVGKTTCGSGGLCQLDDVDIVIVDETGVGVLNDTEVGSSNDTDPTSDTVFKSGTVGAVVVKSAGEGDVVSVERVDVTNENVTTVAGAEVSNPYTSTPVVSINTCICDWLYIS